MTVPTSDVGRSVESYTRLGHSSIKVTLDQYGHLFEGLDEAAENRG